jgi:hypothetical protein
MSTRPQRFSIPRAVILIGLLAACLAALGCQQIPRAVQPSGQLLIEHPALTEGIPPEYGRLVGISQHAAGPKWVTLWFEAPDETITAVGVNIHHGRYDSRVMQIPRR